MSRKMGMGGSGMLGSLGNFIKENGSTISMFAGIVCVLGSLYAAFKASDEISSINIKFDEDKQEIESGDDSDDEKAKKIKELKTRRNVRYILAYKFVGVLGGGAIGFAILSKYLDGLALAGVTAFAMSKEDEIKKLVKNGKEMLGEEKFKEIEDKTLEERVAEKFFGTSNAKKLSISGGGLVVDDDDAIIFQIDMTDLQDVIDRAESYCARNHNLSKAKFLEMLGFVDIPEEASEKWWGPKRPFKAEIVVQRMFNTEGMHVIKYGKNGENKPTTAGEAGVQYLKPYLAKN